MGPLLVIVGLVTAAFVGFTNPAVIVILVLGVLFTAGQVWAASS
jgi:hypothetical protein